MTQTHRQKQREQRHGLASLAGLALLLLAVLLLSAALGSYPVHPWTVLQSLGTKLFLAGPSAQDTVDVVLYNVRFPRLIMAAFVGGGLALAGATFQAMFQNPMVSPDVLGASSGAGFGAALAILMGFSGAIISLWAFFFGLVSLGLVLTLSKRMKQNKLLGLILTGIVVGSLFSAMLSWLKLVADPTNELPAITYWLMGSLNGVTQQELFFAIPLIVAGGALILLLRWQLNVMTLGDDAARSMGIDCRRLRLVSYAHHSHLCLCQWHDSGHSPLCAICGGAGSSFHVAGIAADGSHFFGGH